jgi:CTP synthase
MIPAMLRDAGLDFEVLRLLKIEDKINLRHERKAWAQWCDFTDKIESLKRQINIGITGKYTAVRDSYASIINALEHAGIALGCDAKIKWIETTNIIDDNVADHLADVDGIIVPGGFGTRGAEGKIACIKYAREKNLPFLGLCFGFQMAVIEFARNVCGLRQANSTEIEPDCPEPVIDILPEQKKIEGLGGNMRLGGHDIELNPNTLNSKLFGKKHSIRMRFRHRYEVYPRYIETFEKAGLVFSGKAPNQPAVSSSNPPIMQILEIPSHPFFIATQAHPCLTSRPLRPQPMFLGLVAAAMQRHYPQEKLPGCIEAVEKYVMV